MGGGVEVLWGVLRGSWRDLEGGLGVLGEIRGYGGA